SAALSFAGTPFRGPIGGARVGLINGEYILNPNQEQLKESDLDLVVAGTEAAVLMGESEAKELSEDQMLGAVLFGHDEMQIAIQAIKELASSAGEVESTCVAPSKNEALLGQLKDAFEEKISEAYTIAVKQDRYAALDALHAEAVAQFVPEEDETGIADEVNELFEDLKYRTV